MNHRMPDNYPLRSVVVAGNLMAAALEHTDLYEALEIDSLIMTWHGATARAPAASVPEHLAHAGNTIARALTHRQNVEPHVMNIFIHGWRAELEQLRQIHTQQEAA